MCWPLFAFCEQSLTWAAMGGRNTFNYRTGKRATKAKKCQGYSTRTMEYFGYLKLRPNQPLRNPESGAKLSNPLPDGSSSEIPLAPGAIKTSDSHGQRPKLSPHPCLPNGIGQGPPACNAILAATYPQQLQRIVVATATTTTLATDGSVLICALKVFQARRRTKSRHSDHLANKHDARGFGFTIAITMRLWTWTLSWTRTLKRTWP